MATIKVINLDYSYNDQKIFHNLNLVANCGEFVIILGRSGSGKSTLLYLLSGYLKGQRGTIEYSDKKENNRGIIFQSSTLLNDFSVLYNVALPLLTRGEGEKIALNQAKIMLEKVGMEDMENRQVSQLSGGQQARIQIARALITDPSILLLDEPTGSLDQKSAEELIRLFQKLAKTKLVIMVTHREKTAFSCGTTVYQIQNQRLQIIKKTDGGFDCKSKKRVKEKRVGIKVNLKIGMAFIKKRPFRFFSSVLFLTVSLALLSIMTNLLLNADNIFLSSAQSYYNYNLVYISEINKLEIGDDASLVQKIYPSNLPRIYEAAYLPLDNIVGSTIKAFNRNKSEYVQTRFEPCIGENKIKPVRGREIFNDDEVLANGNLSKELNMTGEELIGSTIELKNSIIIETDIGGAKCFDSLIIDRKMTIVGIIGETEGFNSPAVYYSYENFYRHLTAVKLANASLKLKKNYSVIDRLQDSKPDDDLLGYVGLYVVADPTIIREKIGKKYEVSSTALSYIENSSAVVKNLIAVIEFFLSLIAVGSFLLELFFMTIIYEEQKKILALFKTFDLSKRNYKTLYYGMAEIYSVISIVLSYVFEISFVFILNKILVGRGYIEMFVFSFFNLPNLIMVFLALLLSFSSASFSLHRMNKQNIVLALAEDLC